jgi:Zn-dependent protease with chaperone function
LLVGKVRGRYARKQFEQLTERDGDALRSRWTIGKIVTYGIAALVNGFPLLLLAAAVWLIAANWPSAWAIVYGVILVGLAFVFTPRWGRMPADALDRDDAPHVYEFVDRVADATGAPKVRALVVDAEFNASFRRAGIRRAPVVTIGLPLWTVLDSQERVAVLSHEYAHGINGDSLTHGFVGQAIRTLLHLAYMLKPDFGDFFTAILSPFMAILSGTFNRLAYLMIILSWQRSQEAEFLADYVAGKTAGTAAATSLLRKLELGRYVAPALDPISLSTDWQKHNFFPRFREFVATLPPLERERTKRLLDREKFEAGTTHPPRWARVRFLEHHASEPTFKADPELMATADTELSKLERRLTGALVAMYYPGR